MAVEAAATLDFVYLDIRSGMDHGWVGVGCFGQIVQAWTDGARSAVPG
jgi:hypothetical protein